MCLRIETQKSGPSPLTLRNRPSGVTMPNGNSGRRTRSVSPVKVLRCAIVFGKAHFGELTKPESKAAPSPPQNDVSAKISSSPVGAINQVDDFFLLYSGGPLRHANQASAAVQSLIRLTRRCFSRENIRPRHCTDYYFAYTPIHTANDIKVFHKRRSVIVCERNIIALGLQSNILLSETL